ncbi:nucleolar protein 9-like isoform X2 [Actinia tenebrosa]|uniref:Nucleolar protein 9-like isoform X2 n=1 Tax=Actinia tenebrosa TaxID=6105 RepID=A0A6P8IGM7_ACTTE|nr:nucleolar protein 9-like isoform X2 [Actinia tenebrosa]
MADTENKETSSKSKLDEDTLSYFKRVESVIEDDDFEDEESKKLFVENVFTQVEDHELLLACDQAMSRVLERLLNHLNDAQLKKIWNNLSNSYEVVTCDRFGSHVTQNLVNLVPRTIRAERIKVKEVDKKEEESLSMEELFLSYCTFVEDNLSDLIENTYGSHVVRAVFEVLAGVRVADDVQRSRNSRGCRGKAFKMHDKKVGRVKPVGQAFGFTEAVTASQTIAVPDSFISMLERLSLKMMEMDLKKLVFSHLSCPVLQTLLLVLHQKNPKLCSKLCKKIMNQVEFNETEKMEDEMEDEMEELEGNNNKGENYDDNGNKKYQIPSLFSHDVGSHLVEKILHVISPKGHKKLYKNYFKGHLETLALHHVSNYLVQHLLASTTDPTLGEQMLDELLGEMEELFSAGHDGVVARMAELCVRLEVKQQDLQRAILEAFHCTGKKEKKSSSTLLLSMTTHDIFFGEDDDKSKQTDEENKDEQTEKSEIKKELPRLKNINFHGSVLLKTLLEFQDPKVFVDSLLGMSIEELLRICQDPMGSRTAEAFFISKTVKEKKKHSLCEKLKGEFAKLSCDKQASHVVETCWIHVDISHKELILQELLQDEHKLTKDFFGSKVIKKCGLEQFKRKKGDWIQREEKANKKRQIFDEIIHQEEKKKKKAKGMKEEQQERCVVKSYAAEMAVLGFDTAKNLEDPNTEVASKRAKAHQRQKEDDDIDMIFKAKRTLKGNKNTTDDGTHPKKKKKK